MTLADLVRRNRSFRRFHEDRPVSRQTLRELVDLARLSATGANRQPLKYFLSCDAETNDRIFPHLGWAAYLKDWPGPQEGERPAAYIIILGDTEITKTYGVDHGIAAQSIMLGAVEKGLGGCMILSINRPKLKEALQIADRYEVLLVLALGVPKETVVIDPLGPDGDIKYWREPDGTHHVPKRSLDEVILA
ncbi:MAG: nitroreductase family protein [Chloroflexi bacterium]|nr:nitroreductase family protein [Chloroflexota bacterium]